MADKTLNFYAYGLQGDTTLLFMFEPPKSSKLYIDQFPVAWKVVTFRAGGHAKATVQYIARLAFGYAQINDENLVDSASWVEVMSGDISSITGASGQKRFGNVSKGNNTKLLVCKNNTTERADLSIGFVKGSDIDQRYEPTLVWTGVGSKSNVTAQFTPTLKAYILRGEIETDAIWTCDLNELDDVTGWNFYEDDDSGAFVIEAANSI
ncbi:hypothetical protein CTheo_7807 [Ceratobasidium theobromae]|uniref:Uncharacterized protein n=1 Tax=Ceratobasidium theobromae TaxID=1582974 RepID=A0A5N5QB64_9AGAM|nr:hypothetical protein CTheo_7807 [Ceratobasidium theobromae]